MYKKIAAFVAFICISSFSFAQSWSRLYLGPGVQPINSVCTDQSGNLYVGGYYSHSGDAFVDVLKRSGSSWTTVGAGIPNAGTGGAPGISHMAVDRTGNIYATGNFRNASGHLYISKWDGTNWIELSPAAGQFGYISTLYTDSLLNAYAAGSLEGDTSANVYKWNGSNWICLGTGPSALNANNIINSICTDPAGNVYAGGWFTNRYPWNYGVTYVAKWDGTSWTALDTSQAPLDAFGITSILSDPVGNIYATGMYEDAYGRNVSKWNGTSWSPLGTGSTGLKANNMIRSLARDPSGNIYAAGWFNDTTILPEENKCYVAKWNGTAWSQLGSGNGRLFPHSVIWTICTDVHGNVYAGGQLTNDDGDGIIGKFGAPTGLSDHMPVSGIAICPNPATTYFDIDAKHSAVTGSSYYLYNCMGQTCKTGIINDQHYRVFINDLPAGIYTLQLGLNSSAGYRILKQ